MRKGRVALAGALVMAGYDMLVRPWLLDWGSTPAEREMPLPGDRVDEAVTRHTRAVAVEAPPAAVWPWLVQIGDHRAGFYSYDWVERATGTVHYAEDGHSATRIHPELQHVQVGDRIGTGSVGTRWRIDAPVTVLEPGRALVIGTWAFVLERTLGNRTRLLVREPYRGWLRLAVPARFGLLRALAGALDYAIGEPLHFVMERKMMLGIKRRAERSGAHPEQAPAAVP